MITIPDAAEATFVDSIKPVRFAAARVRETYIPQTSEDMVIVRPGTVANEVYVMGPRTSVQAIIGMMADMGHATLTHFKHLPD